MAVVSGDGPALFWFRRDLRLADNTALTAAAAKGTVTTVYIYTLEEEPLFPGAAFRWWRHHFLEQL